MREITISLPYGKKLVVPYGTRTGEVLSHPEFADQKGRIIGSLVNNEPASLSFKVEINAEVTPVLTGSREGLRIYRRSLCFLLSMATRDIFPERELIIGHSLGDSYYYYFNDDNRIETESLRRLENRMEELIQLDLPIQRRVISYAEALDYFKKRSQNDTFILVRQRNENKIPVYECDDFMDLSYGPLAPSTGMLTAFHILPYTNGFLLQYPPSSSPDTIVRFKDSPVLFSIYQEYKAWGKILGVNSVGKLNELVESGDLSRFIRVAEALHNKKIAEIADRIHERKGDVKVILIAGPSSSGKTTFTKKLSVQLQVLGFNPVIIALDDYFVPRDLTPVDADGNLDFETIKAIDVTLLNRNLIDLFDRKEVEIPDFDFKTGNRKPSGHVLRMSDRSILVIEGIHGLNEELTPLIDRKKKYKIYVSALTQLNLDDHNRISTTDNRLLRRMVRDKKFRGYSALETLQRWPSVRQGENQNIFPFQNNADSAFNSALDYELAVLKLYAEPLLKSVKPNHELFGEAKRLLTFLHNFIHVTEKQVPRDSILREFIGGSAFKY